MAAGQAAEAGRLTIRRLESLDDFGQTLRLQKLIWGFDDGETVAKRLFSVFNRIGGSSLGAFLGRRMVGFTLAFPAFKPDQKPYLHSHMTGVDPGNHNLGIGYQLKVMQLEEARAAGLDLIEWTFDPLQSRNAFFNVEKLGVEIDAYLPNFYGVTSSELHGALPTDRLVAAWHLDRASVRERLAGRGPTPTMGEASIEIPLRISEVPRPEAAAIQRSVRERFQASFAEGLRVVSFERTSRGGVYHLARPQKETSVPASG